jgi:ribosomal-protein-alanine N-acetyltransferase
MILRDRRPADFPELCEIDRICFPPGIAYPPQDLAHWLRQRGSFVVVAEDERKQKLAGFVLGRKQRGSSGHIITIDILPEYRRSGLGSLLMEQAHERLRRMEARRVRLETAVDNASAVAFYQKLGYQAVGRIPQYYLDKIDAWVMSKEL